MQGNGGGRPPFPNFGDPFSGFGGFGGFGGQRSMLSGFFGGQRSMLFGGSGGFDDPFFTRPFGGMLDSGMFGTFGNPFANVGPSGFLHHQVPQPQLQFQPQPQPQFQPHRNRSGGPIIEELSSDDEKEEDNKKERRKSKKAW